MKVKIALLFEKITSSFWIIPAFIIFVMTSLLYVLKVTPITVEDTYMKEVLFLRADADAARLLLSSIATSVMTVTGVLFSVVILVIQQMSNQFTPRVVSNFTRSTIAQIVLGSFVGTFIYCLLLLMNIGESDGKDPIPHLALSFAVILAILCLVLLIYYIHHVTESIQSTEVIANIAREAISTFRNVIKDRKNTIAPKIKNGKFKHELTVYSDKIGYVDLINWKSLEKNIHNQSWTLEFHKSAGDFIQKDMRLLTIKSNTPLIVKNIHKIIEVSPMRSFSQDPGYGIEKLSDIALKALSPGINDPSTAIESIHSITAILLEFFKNYPVPEKVHIEEDKEIRFVPYDPYDLVRQCYDAILAFSKEHGRVKELIRHDLEFIRDHIKRNDLKEILEKKLKTIE